jgi:hypothetical protein
MNSWEQALAVRVCFVLGNLTVSNDDNRQRIGLEFSGTSIALSVLDLAVYRDARLNAKIKKLASATAVTTDTTRKRPTSKAELAMGAIAEEEEDGPEEDDMERVGGNVRDGLVGASGDDPSSTLGGLDDLNLDEDENDDGSDDDDGSAGSIEAQQKRVKLRGQAEAQYKENEDLLVKVLPY